MSEAQDTDLLLVNRNGTSYKQEIDTMRDRIADTDLLLVYRGNQAYKITGEDFIDSTQSYAAPVINNVLLAEDSPGGTRFANQDFNITYNMTDDGEPDSSKLVKPYVIGGISLFGETSAITNVGMSSVQIYVWDGTAPTNLADIETNGTPVATGSQGNLTASTQYFIIVNKGITASRDGDDVFTANGTTAFSITANVANGGAYDAAGNRLGGSGGYNSSEWTLQKWTSDIAEVNTSYKFYTGAAYYILDNLYTVSTGTSGMPDYTGTPLLTLTNANELDYFEVGDAVEINGISGGVTGSLPTNAYVGTGGTYANQAAQWGLVLQAVPSTIDQTTLPWIYFGGGSSNPSTFTFDGTVDIIFYCTEYTTAGDFTISGDARFENSATTIAVPSGNDGDAIGSVKIVPTQSGGSFVLTADTWVYAFGITGNNVISVTAISPSVPSMGVDGGTWAVGDVANNTVERQEQVTLSTDDITARSSVTYSQEGVVTGTEGGPDYQWPKAFNGDLTLPGAAGLYGGYNNYTITFPTPLTASKIYIYVYATAFDWGVNGVQMSSGTVSSVYSPSANYNKYEILGVTSLSSISLGSGNQILGVYLDDTLLVDNQQILTFATDDQLANFQAGWAVKQDAPVTPVTSAITNVVTINATGITPTPEPSFLTQATSGTHSGKGWPEVIGLSPSTTNVDEYWCILPDGGGTQKGTITYANMTVGQTITVRGFGPYVTSSRTCGGDISESYATVTQGTFGTSSAPPTFTVTTTQTDGSFYVDFNGVFNLFGISPGPGGNSVDLTFTDDTQLDNFQAGDEVIGSGVNTWTTTGTPAGNGNWSNAFNGTIDGPGALGSGVYEVTFGTQLAAGHSFRCNVNTNQYPNSVKVNGNNAFTECTASGNTQPYTWTCPNIIQNMSVDGTVQVFAVQDTSGNPVDWVPHDVVSVTPASNQMKVDGGTWANGDTATGPEIDGTGTVVSTDPSAKTMNLVGSNYAAGAGLVDSTAHPKSYAFDGRMDTYCSPGFQSIFRTLFGEEVTINTSFRIYSPNGAGNSLYYKINNGNATQVTTVDGWITIPYTGTTSSIKVASNTGSINVTAIEIDGTVLVDYSRFAIGSEVETANKVPNPDVKLWCVTGTTGSITDLSMTDPGYTTLATTSVLQTLTFPATFPSGVAADTELPVGTTLAVDVQASNIIATVSATTNVVTPTT